MERHVTLVAQQLHVSVLLPAAHTAGAEAALRLGVSLAVLTLRPALPWKKVTFRHARTLEHGLKRKRARRVVKNAALK